MTLFYIILATGGSGLISIYLAAYLSFGSLGKLVRRLVSLSVGLLLATAILNILPEAIESGANVRWLAWTFLTGLLVFISLEKLAVFRHSHHHEGDGHDHHKGHDHEQAGQSGLGILLGDSIHNFSDGLMIAAAFMTDVKLGVVTALAVTAHEVPQEVGDFIVLINAGYTRKRALIYNLISGLGAVLGGVIGYFFLEAANGILPYALMVVVSSFIYIALADLIPSMQQARDWKVSLERTGLLLLGVLIVVVLGFFHQH